MFVGRKKELKLLEDLYASDSSQFIPIYGRRRVGKSELILQFMTLHNGNGLYFLGKKASKDLQIKEFLQTAAKTLEISFLAEISVDSWKQALSLVVKQHTERGQKLIIALDEFQWIAESSPELPSIIQELWDLEWKNSNRVFLILCGSYLGFMEREVLGSKSPLFGRRTANILLAPFSYSEAALFHPDWSVEDQAKSWFLCGGIPYYLNFLKSELSIEQNIRENFLSEYAALFREADFLLREELRELEKYSGILIAIAQKPQTSGELSKATGIPEKSMHYYINTLKTIKFINTYLPLDATGKKKRGIRYRLADNFLRFWYYFVYPNMSLVVSMGPERAYSSLIAPKIDAWFGHSFELLCREAIISLYMSENVVSAFEIGEYWDKAVQIDLVSIRKDGRIDIGECKWGNTSSVQALMSELDRKIINFPNPEGHTINKRLFLKKFTGKTPPGIKVHTLKQLYSLNIKQEN